MKSNIELLNLYKEEKALVIGDIDVRTGLEDFPSFKEWKLEYMKEYAETHDMSNPLSMEEAVAELEKELAAEAADDDDLLPEEDLKALAAEPFELPDEENDVNDDDKPIDDLPNVELTVVVDSRKARKSTKKKAVKKAAAKKRPPSKAKDAQKVFDRMYPKVLAGKKARKDVIDELINKVGLTPNGAATYYQKMKKAAS